jgi:hypothetical protein
MKFLAKYGALVVALTLAVAVNQSRAADRVPLGDFALTALDGRTVQSSQLATADKWLLIYVKPNCRPCEELLRHFQIENPPADYARKVIVIVGGASPEELSRMAERTPWLPAESWYADGRNEAAQSLRAKGMPIVMGVLKRNVEWSLVGVLRDVESFKSIRDSWFTEQPGAAKRASYAPRR